MIPPHYAKPQHHRHSIYLRERLPRHVDRTGECGDEGEYNGEGDCLKRMAFDPGERVHGLFGESQFQTVTPSCRSSLSSLALIAAICSLRAERILSTFSCAVLLASPCLIMSSISEVDFIMPPFFAAPCAPWPVRPSVRRGLCRRGCPSFRRCCREHEREFCDQLRLR